MRRRPDPAVVDTLRGGEQVTGRPSRNIRPLPLAGALPQDTAPYRRKTCKREVRTLEDVAQTPRELDARDFRPWFW